MCPRRGPYNRAGMASRRSTGRVYVGTSGYDYPGWRGDFYPVDVPRRGWLRFAARHFNSVELNGTFYSLKSPDTFRRWAGEVPRAFVLAIKGSRFITHNLKLRRAEGALANFYASGVLALGRRTGPFLWQLPDSYGFDPERMETFIDLLPRDSTAAAALARGHDQRLKRGALTESTVKVRYRHCFEVRNPSYFDAAFFDLLRARRCGYVIADTAGRWGYSEEVTADFAYVRLHGSQQLYASGYTDRELDAWCERIVAWVAPPRALDVYVYFDNDARGHAPHDARGLFDRLRGRLGEDALPGRERAAA
jgi:uncharacterized protein YecE (DUF72 family)